jgi:hypothetical protein
MTDTAGPGPLIGSGRAADVCALGDGQVLRRYKTAHSCAAEAELMRYLREAGYPVPEVFAVAGPDLVMQRLDGRDMLADLASRPWRAVAHARTLARLHDPNVRPAEAARLRRLAGLAAPTPDAPEPTAGEPGAQKPPHPPGPRDDGVLPHPPAPLPCSQPLITRDVRSGARFARFGRTSHVIRREGTGWGLRSATPGHTLQGGVRKVTLASDGGCGGVRAPQVP